MARSGMKLKEPKKKVLPYKGKLNAPVLVVCDPPNADDGFCEAGILAGKQLGVFVKAAEACGFSKNDFIFCLPCPPIPTEIEKNDKKCCQFVDPYRERFLNLLEEVNPQLVMFMGKWAGRITMGKSVKIMKNRGAFQKAEFPSGFKTVLPMISPKMVLVRPEMKDIFDTDFQMAGRLRELNWKMGKIAAADDVKKNYRWCTDISDLIKNPPKAISVDTETTGLKWFTAGTNDKEAVKILTVQICTAPGDVRVIPIDCKYYPELKPAQRKKLVHHLKILLENKKVRKTGHNSKYDTHVLREDLGINIEFDTDTILLAWLCDENMQEKSLDECIRRWVPDMAGYNDANNKKIDKSDMRSVDHKTMLSYAGGDADASFRLAGVLTPLAKADEGQWNCYQKIILPAIKAFCDPMELYGVKVNTKKLAALQKELEASEKEMYEELIQMVPRKIRQKFADPKKPHGGLSFTRDVFVREILFGRDGYRLKPRQFTASTENLPPAERVPSVSTKTHLPYFADNEFVALYMEYVKLQKLRSTYVGVPHDEKKGGPTGFWQHIHNGEIHPSFLLHRVVTGRTSSENPNGQNIPKRGKLAKAYREVFVARKGYTFIETDLSQAELRIAAWEAMEPTMLKIYREGGDIHSMTAANVMGLALKTFMELEEEIREQKRFQAKAVNFGFIYGAWWTTFKRVAKTDYGIDFTDDEAKQIREAFFALYRRLEKWHERRREEVQKYGYVRSLHGAVRHLPGIRSSEEYIRKEVMRQAINAPVQRLGSDLGLIAMIRMVRDFDPEEIRPVLFIHDSLVFEVKDELVTKAQAWIKFYMESPPLKEWFGIEPPLPIVADLAVGKNLGQMEKVKGVKPVPPKNYKRRLELLDA